MSTSTGASSTLYERFKTVRDLTFLVSPIWLIPLVLVPAPAIFQMHWYFTLICAALVACVSLAIVNALYVRHEGAMPSRAYIVFVVGLMSGGMLATLLGFWAWGQPRFTGQVVDYGIFSLSGHAVAISLDEPDVRSGQKMIMVPPADGSVPALNWKEGGICVGSTCVNVNPSTGRVYAADGSRLGKISNVGSFPSRPSQAQAMLSGAAFASDRTNGWIRSGRIFSYAPSVLAGHDMTVILMDGNRTTMVLYREGSTNTGYKWAWRDDKLCIDGTCVAVKEDDGTLLASDGSVFGSISSVFGMHRNGARDFLEAVEAAEGGAPKTKSVSIHQVSGHMR